MSIQDSDYRVNHRPNAPRRSPRSPGGCQGCAACRTASAPKQLSRQQRQLVADFEAALAGEDARTGEADQRAADGTRMLEIFRALAAAHAQKWHGGSSEVGVEVEICGADGREVIDG